MKKITLLLLFVLSSVLVFGQSITITPNTGNEIVLTQYNNIPEFIGRRANGTSTSPTPVVNGSNLIYLGGAGYNGSAFTTSLARMAFLATQTWASGANGTKIAFSTTPNNSTSVTERMVIDESGFVGIGTSSPASKLHAFNGSSGVSPNSFAPLFIENSSSAYLQLGSPEASATGVLFGKPSSAISGGVLYDGSSNLSLRTGGNNIRMTVTSAGDVGIGTTTPDTKLHVEGNENNGSAASLKITSGAQNMLIDGNEIDALADGLFLNNNSAGKVILANGGGNVGIGTSTPNRPLEVSNSGTSYVRVSDASGGSDVGFELFRTGIGFNDWRIANSGGDIDFRFSTDDLATSTVEYQMTSAGFLPGTTNTNSLGSSSFRWTAVHATNGTIQTSDRREKENIKSLNYGLKDILRLSPVRYTWKTGEDKGQKVGLIAQEVATVVPEVVTGLKSDGTVGEGRLGMNYAELVPVLINAIKEQQQIIDQLNQNMSALSSEIASMKKQFDTNSDKAKVVTTSTDR